jgi:hypothetical protein
MHSEMLRRAGSRVQNRNGLLSIFDDNFSARAHTLDQAGKITRSLGLRDTDHILC